MNRRFFAILLAALTGGGLALSQAPDGGVDPNAGTPPATDGTAAGDGAGAGGTGGAKPELEVPVSAEAQLTTQEQIDQAHKIYDDAKMIDSNIGSQLTNGRKSKDFMLVTCLEDKHAQSSAYVGTLSERVPALESAAEQGLGMERDHEFTIITVLGTKMAILKKEADQCIGKQLYDTGSTVVATFVDPGTPLDDASRAPNVPDVQIPFIPPPVTGPM